MSPFTITTDAGDAITIPGDTFTIAAAPGGDQAPDPAPGT
jgi:hypothetical protein